MHLQHPKMVPSCYKNERSYGSATRNSWRHGPSAMYLLHPAIWHACALSRGVVNVDAPSHVLIPPLVVSVQLMQAELAFGLGGAVTKRRSGGPADTSRNWAGLQSPRPSTTHPCMMWRRRGGRNRVKDSNSRKSRNTNPKRRPQIEQKPKRQPT